MKLFILLSVIVLITSSAAEQISWYHETGLSGEELNRLTSSGCYRGSFGPLDSALLTCAPKAGAEPFTTSDENTHFCLLELVEVGTDLGELAMLLNAPAQVYLAMEAGLILIRGSSEDFSPLCFAPNYGPLVSNRIFVPRQPLAPQAPMPENHPAVRRTLLREKGTEVEKNPAIASYLNRFSKLSVSSYLANLSTDYHGTNKNITRNSYAIKKGVAGCVDSNWRCANDVVSSVVHQVEKLLATFPHEWSIEELTFNADMCNNIRLVIPGVLYPDQIVAIGAHLDSRNTGSSRTATGAAPGADDNASGSAVNLEIVRSIAANEVKYQFAYTVHILWFCGEEQGLVGSSALAQSYKSQGADIIAYFNNDMIAYTDPSFGIRLSFMTRFSTAWLTNVCKEIAGVYLPDLASGDTAACCSDQQSFYSAGFPAAGIFETPTSSVSYPKYHNSGDTWDNGLINYEQVYQFGQANFACILEFADPILSF